MLSAINIKDEHIGSNEKGIQYSGTKLGMFRVVDTITGRPGITKQNGWGNGLCYILYTLGAMNVLSEANDCHYCCKKAKEPDDGHILSSCFTHQNTIRGWNAWSTIPIKTILTKNDLCSQHNKLQILSAFGYGWSNRDMTFLMLV